MSARCLEGPKNLPAATIGEVVTQDVLDALAPLRELLGIEDFRTLHIGAGGIYIEPGGRQPRPVYRVQMNSSG